MMAVKVKEKKIARTITVEDLKKKKFYMRFIKNVFRYLSFRGVMKDYLLVTLNLTLNLTLRVI